MCAISPEKWGEYQQNRAISLFKRYPDVKKAYEAVLEFREWYEAKPTYFEPFTHERELGNGIGNNEDNPNVEIENFRNLVINQEQRILNDHKHQNRTNSIAESVNAKIHEAMRQSKASRDLDFFHYRIARVI